VTDDDQVRADPARVLRDFVDRIADDDLALGRVAQFRQPPHTLGEGYVYDARAEEEELRATIAGAFPIEAIGEIGPDGSFYYTPAPGFSGIDTFTYRVSDGTNLSEPVTVSIHVGSADVGMWVGRPWTRYSARRGARFLVFGGLGLRHRAKTMAVTLRCYRLEEGTWVLRKSFTLNGASGRRPRYAGYVRLPERGRWRLVAEHVDGDGGIATSLARYMRVR